MNIFTRFPRAGNHAGGEGRAPAQGSKGYAGVSLGSFSGHTTFKCPRGSCFFGTLRQWELASSSPGDLSSSALVESCATSLADKRSKRGNECWQHDQNPHHTVNNVPFAFTPKTLSKFDSFMAPSGPLLFGPVSQAIAQSRNKLAGGFARGCVSNTKSGEGEYEISQEGPASAVWPGPPYSADRQFSVGDNGNLSSRAGCVNCACPVR
jgi:hypothetical protein